MKYRVLLARLSSILTPVVVWMVLSFLVFSSCQSTEKRSGGGAYYEFSGNWVTSRAEQFELNLYLQNDKSFVLIGTRRHPSGWGICRYAERGSWATVSEQSIRTTSLDQRVSHGCVRQYQNLTDGIVSTSGMRFRGFILRRSQNESPLTWEEAQRYISINSGSAY